MARIIVDSSSHQAIRHAGAEAKFYGIPPENAGRWRDRRLTGFIGAMAAKGHSVSFALPSTANLERADVLVVASRSQALMFSSEEVASISGFVGAGGGLLLMANHRLFVLPQRQISAALALPLRIEDVTIRGEPPIGLSRHPLTDGCQTIAIRNAAVIIAEETAEVVATYSDPQFAFAVACEGSDRRRGRVVVTADSGFMASLDDKMRPLFETADNRRFLTNAVSWLL